MMPRRLSLLSVAVCAGWSILGSAHAQTLIAHYKFDGTLASEVVPLGSFNPVAAGTFRQGTDAATAPAGTATFAAGVTGLPNTALVLDGVDDWIDLTTAGRPNSATPVGGTYGPGTVSGTIAAWVRAESQEGPRWLMGVDNAQDQMAFRLGSNGSQLEMQASGSATGNSLGVVDASNNSTWSDGHWHHVAATWDGGFAPARLYVDGAQIAISGGSTFDGGDAQTPWEVPMAVGARDLGGTLEGFFAGRIDDLRIYANALTSFQIGQIISGTPRPDGDFDADEFVNGTDFLAWQRGFGTGTTRADGDANGDMAVDAIDLEIWGDSYGQAPAAVSAVASVPEPQAAALLLIGALRLRRRRGTTA